MEQYREDIQQVQGVQKYRHFLDAQDELKWSRFEYFPEHHYSKALEDALRDEFENELVPDGGSRTQYYWSGEDGILYHTEKEEDMVIPFFNTVEDAEHFLENQADQYGEERYQGMILRKTGNRKVEEATDVLTSQSGLADFAGESRRL